MTHSQWIQYQEKLAAYKAVKAIKIPECLSSYSKRYFDTFKSSALGEVRGCRSQIKSIRNISNRVDTYYFSKKEDLKRKIIVMLEKHFGHFTTCSDIVIAERGKNAYTFHLKWKSMKFEVIADKHWRKINNCRGKVIGLGGEARLINKCELIQSNVNGFGIDLYKCNVLAFKDEKLHEEEIYIGINFDYNFFAYSINQKHAVKNVQKKIARYVAGRLSF